ncbi:hypothetical protein Tco_1499015 [Tanacetum coccineum]
MVEDGKETSEIKKLMEIIPDEEEVAIDAIHLAVKSPTVIDVESSATSFSKAETLLLNWKIDAKFGNADRGFVSLVVGGGVGVDYGGGGVKDGNDCGMTVVYTSEDLVITKIDAKSDEWEELVTGTSVFFAIV